MHNSVFAFCAFGVAAPRFAARPRAFPALTAAQFHVLLEDEPPRRTAAEAPRGVASMLNIVLLSNALYTPLNFWTVRLILFLSAHKRETGRRQS